MESVKIRILIADDHALFRSALKKLLEMEPDFQVIGEAHNGREVRDKVSALHPDVLLLDFNMRSAGGLEILRSLDGAVRGVRIIILTGEIKGEEVVEALRLGAHGFVLKEMASQLLFRSIRSVMGGEYWVDRKSVAGLVSALKVIPVQHSGGEPANSYRLTKRELQIVAAIVDGCTNRDIAQKFSLSEQTVKHHLTNIFHKVSVSNRLELALFAMNHNLVPEE